MTTRSEARAEAAAFSLATFWVREGSSLAFSAFILFFAYFTPASGVVQHTVGGLFIAAMAALFYLALQMSLAAFSPASRTRSYIDLTFSLIPLLVLLLVFALGAAGRAPITTFHVYAMLIMAAVVLLDVVFNTQVMFRIVRLAPGAGGKGAPPAAPSSPPAGRS